MTCRDIQDLIMTDYLDGEASADVKKKVEEHLSACAPCREYLAAARKLDAGFKGPMPAEAPERIWMKVRDKIEERRVPVWERVRSWWEEVIWGFRPTFVYSSLAASTLVVALVLIPLAWQMESRMAFSEKEEISHMVYLDENSSVISSAEDVGKGTLVENWL